MALSKKLNLISYVMLANGQKADIHSMPIRREIFEQHFMVMSKAFTQMFANGLSYVTGPRIALMLIRQVAKSLGVEEEVEQGLIAEMIRLSNIMIPSPTGWSQMPVYDAVAQKLIEDEDYQEFLNALAFFTLVSAVQGQKGDGVEILEGMAGLWGTSITLSTTTEYFVSLPTSTATETSVVMEASSVPS